MSVLGLSDTLAFGASRCQGPRGTSLGESERSLLWLASNGNTDRRRSRRPKKTIDFFLVVASASPLVPENPNAISGTVRDPGKA